MVFTTDEAGVGPGNDRIIGMRVDAQGDMVWSNPPLAVAMAASRKSRLAIALGAGGDAILIWEDDRSGAKDIYGQSINADGTLGLDPAGCDPLTLATQLQLQMGGAPPGRASLTLATSVALSDACLHISDLTGRRLRTVPIGSLPAGRHVLHWDGRNVHGAPAASGLYLYWMTTGQGTSPPVRGILIR